MAQINWLHFTDLHFGAASQDWLWPTFQDLLYEDLGTLHDEAGPWDFVFFSGDLTQAGKAEQFEQLDRALIKLWAQLKSLGSRPYLIAVPGNHDILRPSPTDPTTKALNHWHQDVDIRNAFWESLDNRYRQFLNDTLRNYIAWYEKTEIPKPNDMKKGPLPGDFALRTKHSGLVMGIVGLNSTFLQITDDIKEGDLDLHVSQPQIACEGDHVAWCKANDLSILLTHHPHKWLHVKSQETFLNDIYPPGRFYAHFFGHLHEPTSLSISEAGSEPRRFRQGPSLFGLKHWGDPPRERKIHGFTAGRFEVVDSLGTELSWPRRSIARYAGHTRIAPDQGFELNERNCVVVSFTVARLPSFDNVEAKVVQDLQGFQSASRMEVDEQGALTSEKLPVDLKDISLTEGGLDQKASLEKLASVPRNTWQAQPHHCAIRVADQAHFEAIILRKRVGWLVCDWGFGKEGFVGAILQRLRKNNTSIEVFKISAEKVDSIEDFLGAVQDQLGMSLHTFCNLCASLPSTLLIVDGIPSKLTPSQTGVSKSGMLKAIVQPILDYAPGMSLVFISREKAKDSYFESTILGQLDLSDTKNYVANHPYGGAIASDKDTLEVLFEKSDGLPMHLDSLLDSLRFSSLAEVSEIGFTPSDRTSEGEPIPDALKKAVGGLAHSKDRYSQRSYKLLKVLTVLSNGETLKNISHFYPAEPFFPRNTLELEQLSLLEVVPLISPATDVAKRYRISFQDITGPKLLKVPLQVRDYVASLISEKEHDEIVKRGAEILFGPQWREGIAKGQKAFFLNVGDVRETGSGNRHIIAKHILRRFLQTGNQISILNASRLCVSLVEDLVRIDAYKDACNAAEEFIYLVSSTDLFEELSQLYKIHGQTLRMTGKSEKAIDSLQKALTQGTYVPPKETQASIQLDLAYANFSLGEIISGRAAAQKALELTSEESSIHIAATAELLLHEEDENKDNAKLVELERLARSKNYKKTANNIALDLSKTEKNESKKLEYQQRVLDSEEDIYNHVRAIIDRAEFLIKEEKISELSDGDRYHLGLGYTYTFSQRLMGLFNRCHRGLWSLLKLEGKTAGLFRIFRHSSFMWRLTDNLEIENEFIAKLVKVGTEKPIDPGLAVSALDLDYYNRRRADREIAG